MKTKLNKEAEVTEQSVETVAATESKQVKKNAEIPDKVKAILKRFDYIKTVYVNEKGGVYTEDTPENVRGEDAVLYNNPYFKSK